MSYVETVVWFLGHDYIFKILNNNKNIINYICKGPTKHI